VNHTTEDINAYLNGLRESGAINMFGAVPYLEDTFDMSKAEAKAALFAWMDECRKGATNAS
jgi:hypothetical protein